MSSSTASLVGMKDSQPGMRSSEAHRSGGLQRLAGTANNKAVLSERFAEGQEKATRSGPGYESCGRDETNSSCRRNLMAEDETARLC